MSENATNGYEWRNKTLCYSELPTTHETNTVTEKRLRRSSPFCVPTPDSSPTNFEIQKLRTMKSTFSVIYYLKRLVSEMNLPIKVIDVGYAPQTFFDMVKCTGNNQNARGDNDGEQIG